MQVKIEKGVPIQNAAQRIAYPFAEMQVGDSFALPKDQANNVRTAASRFVRNNKTWRFTTRVIDDVIRIWREA